MLSKTFILALLITIVMEESAANYKIESTNFISADPEYIDNKTVIMSTTNYNSILKIYLQLNILKAFPLYVHFYSQLFLYGGEDKLLNLEDYFSRICAPNDPFHRSLPIFLRYLTADRTCIEKGNYTFLDAGIFQFSRPDYYDNYILNANEIAIGDRILLKYDIVLSYK